MGKESCGSHLVFGDPYYGEPRGFWCDLPKHHPGLHSNSETTNQGYIQKEHGAERYVTYTLTWDGK